MTADEHSLRVKESQQRLERAVLRLEAQARARAGLPTPLRLIQGGRENAK